MTSAVKRTSLWENALRKGVILGGNLKFRATNTGRSSTKKGKSTYAPKGPRLVGRKLKSLVRK